MDREYYAIFAGEEGIVFKDGEDERYGVFHDDKGEKEVLLTLDDPELILLGERGLSDRQWAKDMDWQRREQLITYPERMSPAVHYRVRVSERLDKQLCNSPGMFGTRHQQIVTCKECLALLDIARLRETREALEEGDAHAEP